MENDVKKILQSESLHIKRLHEIVNETISTEKLILDNLLNPPKEILTSGQKVSDKVARFGGSWVFIICFAFFFIIWIVFNSILPKDHQFDPYPFILMNLVLSLIAALQAPIIMMSQNRQEEIDRKRSENDYMINLKAELEIRALNQKIDLLLEEQIKVLFDIQAKQIEKLHSIENLIQQKK